MSTISIPRVNPYTFTADVLPSFNVLETTAKIPGASYNGPARTHLNGQLPIPKELSLGYFRDD